MKLFGISRTLLSCQPVRCTVMRAMSNETKVLTLEIEKELFAVKRKMTDMFHRGMYHNALDYAVEIETRTRDIIGKRNAVYASSLNNVALMNKHIGNFDVAMKKYTEALQIYRDIAGKQNNSYASTLANIGQLYMKMAEAAKGMDKLEILERADEALLDSLRVRKETLGAHHRDTINSQIQYSTLLRLRNKLEDAEKTLREVLQIAEVSIGANDTLTATVLNNLGFVLKMRSKLDEAQERYTRALAIRMEVLGEGHPDTIVTLHNIAELCYVRGDEKKALEIQQGIVETLRKQMDKDEAEHHEALKQQAAAEQGRTVGNNAGTVTRSVDQSPSGKVKVEVRKSMPATVEVATRKAVKAEESGAAAAGALGAPPKTYARNPLKFNNNATSKEVTFGKSRQTQQKEQLQQQAVKQDAASKAEEETSDSKAVDRPQPDAPAEEPSEFDHLTEDNEMAFQHPFLTPRMIREAQMRKPTYFDPNNF